MWKNKLALPITMVAMALGILISLQVQTQKEVSEAEKIQEQRLAQIQAVLENFQKQNEALKAERAELIAQLDEARKQGVTDPSLLAMLDYMTIMDGTQAVQGPGIQFTIDDRPKEHKITFAITPDDLNRIVNTLRFAGAEAISINGQRIVSTTNIVYSGSSTILVNQVPITRVEGVPYEILAIGDQDVLVDYVTNLEARNLKELGMAVSITRKTVTIPSYKGGYNFREATPVENPA